MTTLAKSAIFCGVMVVVCTGICCGTLSELFPDENYFPYAIRTDGRSIYQVHDLYERTESSDVLAASHRSLESPSLPKLTIKSFSDDLQMLTITANRKSESSVNTRLEMKRFGTKVTKHTTSSSKKKNLISAKNGLLHGMPSVGFEDCRNR